MLFILKSSFLNLINYIKSLFSLGGVGYLDWSDCSILNLKTKFLEGSRAFSMNPKVFWLSSSSFCHTILYLINSSYLGLYWLLLAWPNHFSLIDASNSHILFYPSHFLPEYFHLCNTDKLLHFFVVESMVYRIEFIHSIPLALPRNWTSYFVFCWNQ